MHFAFLLRSITACAVLCAALGGGLQGCTSRVASRLEAEYGKTHLPTRFDLDDQNDATGFTLSVASTEKKSSAYADARNGSEYVLASGGHSVDGSLFTETGPTYIGATFGLGDRGAFRLGGLFALSPRMGPFVGLGAVGLTMNFSRVHIEYQETPFLSPAMDETYAGPSMAIEFPVRAGLLLDLGPVSPYASASFSVIPVGIRLARETMTVGDLSAGLQCAFSPGTILRLEASAASASGESESDRARFPHPQYGLRAEFEREF